MRRPVSLQEGVISTKEAVARTVVMRTDETLARTIQKALDRAGLASVVVDGVSGEVLAGAAACIVATRRLDEDAERLLSEVSDRWPALPVVLVTDGDADNARRLGRVKVDEVVWSEHVEQDLGAAVERVAASGLLERFTRALERHPVPESDLYLRDRFAEVCRSAPPVPRVHEFADRCFLSESQLERRLTAGFGAGWQPSVVLRWIRLLATLDLLGSGLSVERAAARAGVAESTVRAAAADLAGIPLADLRRQPTRALEKALDGLGMRE